MKRITYKPQKRVKFDGRLTEYVISGPAGTRWHREGNRPAYINLDSGIERYYYLGQLHRTDGPAEINHTQGIYGYFVFGTWFYTTGLSIEPAPQSILAYLEAIKLANDRLASLTVAPSKGLRGL